MKKIPALLLLCILLTSVRLFGQSSRDTAMNILWIIADDFSPDAGCYGDTLVRTPHIDALAAKGIRYDQAYATNPVCSPSRSAFYTGMYQTSTGTHQHRTENKKELPGEIHMVTKYFRDAGYFTCNGSGLPDSKPGKQDFNFIPRQQAFDGSDWSQRKDGQPFFATVQLTETHRVFTPDPDHPVDPAKVTLPPYYPDHPLSRKDWAMYLESVQVMDGHLGKVLQRLKQENIADRTIIFFFADQGRPHLRGKQWLYQGGVHVPLIVYDPRQKENGTSDKLVSLIDLAPTSLALAGIPIPGYLQGHNFLDPESKERDYVFAGRNRTDAVIDYIRMIKGRKYKYIRNYMPEKPYTQFGHYKAYRYPMLTLMQVLHQQGELSVAQEQFMAEQKPVEELYDLETDPYELDNLAFDPDYQKVLFRMRSALVSWEEETADMGAYDPDDYEALLGRRQEKYGPRWKERGIDPRLTPKQEYLNWWMRQLGLNNN